MRISTETLLHLAEDFTTQRTRAQRDILAVYLHGSLLADTPVIGGTADIDLFFVHIDRVEPHREIERITDDIHLDVAHDAREVYRRTQALRMHPWMGPVINSCKILYDPQHILDFIQAGVRSQFDRPDNVLARARQQAQLSRQAWLGFQRRPPAPGPQGLKDYLSAVEAAANAVALLSGPPLTERRFLLQFAQRAQAANRPGLLAGLLGLLGGAHAASDLLRTWLPAWQAAYRAQPAEASAEMVRLHPHRFNYYSKALEVFLSAEATAQMALWPLLLTWTDLAFASAAPDAAPLLSWQEAVAQLGLAGDSLLERLAALDAYLDTVDESLDAWGEENGA